MRLALLAAALCGCGTANLPPDAPTDAPARADILGELSPGDDVPADAADAACVNAACVTLPIAGGRCAADERVAACESRFGPPCGPPGCTLAMIGEPDASTYFCCPP